MGMIHHDFSSVGRKDGGSKDEEIILLLKCPIMFLRAGSYVSYNAF